MTDDPRHRELRSAFGDFATGVTVVTAIRPDGERVGVTANSFSSVSLEPPMLLWCLAAASRAVPAFVPGAPFAVHVLAHHQHELALHFARRGHEKFDAGTEQAAAAPPVLADVLCRFDCRVHAVHPGGDHLVILGAVLGFARRAGTPLAFHAGRFGHFSADRGAARLDVWDELDEHGY